MKSKHRLLSLALSAALLGTMLPAPGALAAGQTTCYVSSTGDDGGSGSQSAPYATLEKAYAAVPDGGSIVLMDDLELTEKLELSEDKDVTIAGAGDVCVTYVGSDTIPNTSDGLIAVRAGAVTFENITLQMPQTPGVNGRVLYIGPGGSATLGGGGVVAHGYLAYDGGGVQVEGGSFTMAPGSAVRNNFVANNTGCAGGGVSVTQGGTFTMTGGVIQGNTVHSSGTYRSCGGGVAVDRASTFHLQGGTIEQNAAGTVGGGVYLEPGAAMTLQGNVTLHRNTAGGREDNLYLPQTTALALTGTVSGKVGVTCEAQDYDQVVATAQGYSIRVLDEGAFCTDGGRYDVRLKDGKLVLYWFTVPVALRLDGLDSANPVSETPIGEDFSTTLIPQEGYQLPPAVTVAVGGVALDGASFSYDPASGALHIPGSQVAGSISLTAAGDAVRTVHVTAQNVHADVDTATALFSDTVTIHLTPADRYALPETDGVSVSGACDSTYQDGVLTLTHIASNVTVSLRGAEISHTISFDPAAGSCPTPSKTIPESQTTLGELPVPFLEGYTFSGWFAGETRVTADTSNHLTGDVTLTARWTQKTNLPYVTEHWVEHLSGGMNPGYTGDTLQSMTHQGVTRQYYLYQTIRREDGISNGRLDLAQHTLTAFSGGLSLAGLIPSGANEYDVVVAPDGSSVYPLFYDRGRCTVSYDPNGGSMNPVSTAVAYGGRYAVMPTADRAGYTLLGWYTLPRGGAPVLAGDVCRATADITLYAHWAPVGDTPYTVYHMTQNLRDNTVSWDKTPEHYTVAQTDTLHGTSGATVDVYAIALEGFRPSESNTYTLTIRPDGSAALYLYYDRLYTDVAFDSTGGAPVALAMRLYYGGTFAFVPAAPSRVGHAFQGWYTGKAPTDQKVQKGTEINALNPEGLDGLTLYAHWEAKTYPLAFESHGGTLSGEKSVTYGQPAGELPTAALTGYLFQGWYDADGKLGVPEGNLITEDTLVSADTLISAVDSVETVKTLYAWYEPVTVTLTLDPAEGTLEEGQRTRVLTYDKPLGELPVPVREGHTLRAWHWDSVDGEVLTGHTICKRTGDAVAVAEYVPNVYAVKLNPKGGEADLESLLVTYGEPYGTLPLPTRQGYTFQGWFREDGSQVQPDTVLRLTAGHTLAARWEAVQMTVAFAPGEEAVLPEDAVTKTVAFDAPYGALPVPTWTGRVFQGWFTEESAGEPVTEDTVVAEIAHHTLYAHWRIPSVSRPSRPSVPVKPESNPVVYTLTFETDGGSPLEPLKVPAGAQADLTGYVPQREGFTFLGWFADQAHTQAVEDSVTLQAHTTLYAKWEMNLMSMLERDVHMAYILGFPNGTVRPNAKITRAEVAMMFFRLLNERARELYATRENTFLDVSVGNWHCDAVSTLAAMGIVKGRTGSRYAPDAPITRAEFAVIAARFSDASYEGGDLFDDIQDSWARLEINRAASLGWIVGDGSGSFRPQEHMTRAEAVAFINRVLERQPAPDALLPGMVTFPDNADETAWYYLDIQEAANSHTYHKDQDGAEVWDTLN